MSAPVDDGPPVGRGTWTPSQKVLAVLVALCDGFDIQVLGSAIPTLMKELVLARGAFAPKLAAGLRGWRPGAR
jgi:AAHS family 4-hydroxybenzoate transporter-like MFS transporter